jgi:hypothetical protein
MGRTNNAAERNINRLAALRNHWALKSPASFLHTMRCKKLKT